MTERMISRDELEKHDNIQSCWMTIHGKVYDVTKFLDSHPGGPDVLIEQAGGDATNGFENVGHSESARKQLAEFLIGTYDAPSTTAKKEAKKTQPGASSFATILKFLVPAAAVAFALYVRFYAQNHAH